MIEREAWGEVRLLRFAHGKVSAMDAELLESLESELAAAEDDAVGALVLTGTGSSFSAGVDLFRILDGGTPYVDRFLPLLSRVFLRAFTFSRPLVAALNGHAIAGGCILACAADVCLMAAGTGRIGVPELRVGVPFPAAALELVRFAVGARGLQEIVLGGATFSPEEALRRGLVDEVVSAPELLGRARTAAESLASVPAPSFALTKRELRQPTVERIARFAREQGTQVEAVWRAPETHAAIRAYLDHTLGRKRA